MTPNTIIPHEPTQNSRAFSPTKSQIESESPVDRPKTKSTISIYRIRVMQLLSRASHNATPAHRSGSTPFQLQSTALSTPLARTICTYDHRYWKTRDPVRSPIDKPVTARLVVGSVTTSESLVLYVFVSFCSTIMYSLGGIVQSSASALLAPQTFPIKQVRTSLDAVL